MSIVYVPLGTSNLHDNPAVLKIREQIPYPHIGVFGLTRLLQENDWMPQQSGCSLPLWAGIKMSTTASDRVVCIPPGSTLAIDGNGLAYHLHNVAYFRHFCQVTGSSSNNNNNKATKYGLYCTCKWQLTETQVINVLPQSLPLDLLDQVTREFVNALHANPCKKLWCIGINQIDEGRQTRLRNDLNKGPNNGATCNSTVYLEHFL